MTKIEIDEKVMISALGALAIAIVFFFVLFLLMKISIFKYALTFSSIILFSVITFIISFLVSFIGMMLGDG